MQITAKVNDTSPTLKSSLSKMLDINLTDEDLLNWINKNSSILEDKISPNFIWGYNKNYIKATHYSRTDGFEFFITKNPAFIKNMIEDQYQLNDLKLEEESIILGTDIIPQLYLIKAYMFDKPILGKQLAYNEFLFTALKSFGFHSKEIAKFYYNNEKKINNLRQHFEHSPKYLGGGQDGIAFLIGKSLVLKIFTQNYAYEKAKEAMERLYKHPLLAKTEAMIYDVDTLGSIEGNNIYYYIIERMEPAESHPNEFTLDTLLKIIKYEILNSKYILEPLASKIHNKNQHKFVFLTIQKVVKQIEMHIREDYSEKIKELEEGYELTKANWLSNLIEELILKRLTGRLDLHTGNIGVTNMGELRYFDPAFGKPNSIF